MSNIIKSMTVACVMGVFALGSTGSFAYTTSCPDGGAGPLNGCTLPGLVDGSYPYFNNVVTVDYSAKSLEKKGYFDIKAKAVKGSTGSLVAAKGEEYSIERLKYDLKSRVYEDGATGKIKIGGKIDGQSFKVSADLNPSKDTKGAWNSSGDSMLWGFNTYNITCSGLENYVDCTTAEVVFLNLLSAIGPATGLDKVSTAGTALTSVPVPAAVWLFGSGLIGLLAVSRRNSSKV